jgi:hypothetical protein
MAKQTCLGDTKGLTDRACANHERPDVQRALAARRNPLGICEHARLDRVHENILRYRRHAKTFAAIAHTAGVLVRSEKWVAEVFKVKNNSYLSTHMASVMYSSRHTLPSYHKKDALKPHRNAVNIRCAICPVITPLLYPG